MSWRIGNHYQVHVYDGEVPVATFHTVIDARRAVEAVNRVEQLAADVEEQGARLYALQQYLGAALAKLAESGWYPFGTHVDGTMPIGLMDFSEQLGEDGLPYFERVIEG